MGCLLDWKNDANWKATIDENLRMGILELLILQLLCERDMYGYEIKKILAERTGNALQFGESPLYIPLLRITSRGLVSSRKEYPVGKRFRTYYHIEEFGKEYLAYGKEQYRLLYENVMKIFNQEGLSNEKQ